MLRQTNVANGCSPRSVNNTESSASFAVSPGSPASDIAGFRTFAAPSVSREPKSLVVKEDAPWWDWLNQSKLDTVREMRLDLPAF